MYLEHKLGENARENLEEYWGSRRSKANKQKLVKWHLSRWLLTMYDMLTLLSTGFHTTDYISSYMPTHTYGVRTVL